MLHLITYYRLSVKYNMVAIVGSRRYGLPVLPGTRASPGMRGGNIFRRGLDFIKRNAGRLLRGTAKVLPYAIDRFVSSGSEKGHIPMTHKKVYDDYRKYVHMLPGLLNPAINKLEERLNRGMRPVNKSESKLDDVTEKVINSFQDRAVKIFAPEAQHTESDTTGGKLNGTVFGIKPKAKKTKSKKKSNRKKIDSMDMNSQDYKKLIIGGIVKGAGLMTHSLTTE